MIVTVRVNVVLNRTVVVDSDWRFSNLAVVIFRVKVSFITSVDVVGLSVIPSYTWTLLGPKMSDRLIFFLGTLSFKATQFQSYSSSETQVQEKRRDKSFQVPAEEAGPGYRLGHQTISKRSSKCWLLIGHKKILCRYYCSQSANSIPELFSCVRTRRLFFSPYLQRNARNQETFSLIKTPSISKYCLAEN